MRKDRRKKYLQKCAEAISAAFLTIAIFFMCLVQWEAEPEIKAAAPKETVIEQIKAAESITVSKISSVTDFSVEVEVVAEEEKADTAQNIALYDVPLGAELQTYIIEQAEAHKIDPAIIFAMCFRESSYIATAKGDGGNSYGLMQIQKRYHLDRMERLGVTDLLDPYQNVTVGIDFFAELLAKYDGSVEMALTSYNCGASGAYKHFFSKGLYASSYAKNVIKTAEELKVME